jgi:hypothetical protein
MITVAVSLYLALALPGAPANEGAPLAESAPLVIASSSTGSASATLADLTQFSSTAPILAAPEAMVVNPVITPVKPTRKREFPIPFAPRSWLVMTAIQHSVATFDAWSTRRSISSGRGHELNPLMKPFAGSGAIYGAIQLAPFASDYLARRLMSSKHPTLRKLWWVPQAAGSAGFVLSGINNLRIASR